MFTKGPVKTNGRGAILANGTTDTYDGLVLGTIIRCEELHQTDTEGRSWTADGSCEDNANLVAAAFNAATAIEAQGYDGAEAVKTLPRIIEALEAAKLDIEDGDEQGAYAIITHALGRLRNKEQST